MNAPKAYYDSAYKNKTEEIRGSGECISDESTAEQAGSE